MKKIKKILTSWWAMLIYMTIATIFFIKSMAAIQTGIDGTGEGFLFLALSSFLGYLTLKIGEAKNRQLERQAERLEKRRAFQLAMREAKVREEKGRFI